MASQSLGGITQPDDTDPLADIALALRTAIAEIGDPWAAYVPVLGNITLGNGVLVARWKRIGKTVYVDVTINAGSTTTYSAGNLTIGLPVNAQGVAGRPIGFGTVLPAGTSASRRNVTAEILTASTAVMVYEGGTVSNTLPAAFGTASIIRIKFCYEAA